MLCKGLDDVCGLYTEKKYPKAWQAMFSAMGIILSKDKFLQECEINYSVEGSNIRIGEEETVYSF